MFLNYVADEKELRKLQVEMMKGTEKNNKSKKRKVSSDLTDRDREDESTSNSLLTKINIALHLNRELTVVLEEIKEVNLIFRVNIVIG